MPLTRRHLLAATATTPFLTQAKARPRFQAVSFDGFPIFDPRPIAAACEAAFASKGALLLQAWRIRQFEYQWLSSMMGRYIDFMAATEASLEHAAESLELPLSPATKTSLLDAYRRLPVWPDVAAAVRRLEGAGVRLAIVSNMTAQMLHDGLERAGLARQFELVYSTEQLRRHKPDVVVYEHASSRLGLPTKDVLFVPFAAWDLAGACAAGHPAFWLNRAGMRNERLGYAAQAEGRSLQDLVAFALPGGA